MALCKATDKTLILVMCSVGYMLVQMHLVVFSVPSLIDWCRTVNTILCIYYIQQHIYDTWCMWICRRVHHSPKFVYDILNYLEVIWIWFQCGIMNVCTNELQPTKLGMLCDPQWMNRLKSAWSPSNQPGVSGLCEGHSHPLGQISANSRGWGILAFGLQSICPCIAMN